MYIVPISPLTPLFPASDAGQAVQGQSLAGLPFSDVLQSAMKDMADTQAAAQQDSYDLALGRVDDLHTVQINSAKAEAAISLTASVTSKVISAYNEIIRMQI